MVGPMRMVPEPLDDVDGLAHVFGAIVELNDVDPTLFICRENGADGGLESSSTRLKSREEAMMTT